MNERRRTRPDTYYFFFVFFAVVVFLIHTPWVELPFYWDELGQFVPASLDLFNDGAWIPRSTTPNSHPPGLMAVMAAVWSVAGFSIEASRLTMLLFASGVAFVTFLLAVELCGGVGGAPALTAVLLLLASPLFYMQSILVQLDLPAALFSLLGLYLFLRGRDRWAGLSFLLAVLFKETAIAGAAALFLLRWRRKRYGDAACYVPSLIALTIWFVVLAQNTGHVFGNAEYTGYNVNYALHPGRIAAAVIRRLYTVFVQDGHWIGTLAIATIWRKRDLFQTEAWRASALYAAASAGLVCVVGGATLERYLLPVLPLFYVAAAAALQHLRTGFRALAQGGLMAALIAGLFVNPPYPFPYENNLTLTDFVKVHHEAAEFLDRHAALDARIVSVWPFTDAVRRPEFGYTQRPMRAREIHGFERSRIQALTLAPDEFLVVYSRLWEPEYSLLRLPRVRWLLESLYGYEPQATAMDYFERFGPPVARWRQGSQWVSLYAPRGAK
ncbi:MAG: glycosyltransferase family 39 protein [Acidobacteria bacterium]|nr:glycosyltransferase family 39 protein [Acidobacteriota bacterium]